MEKKLAAAAVVKEAKAEAKKLRAESNKLNRIDE